MQEENQNTKLNQAEEEVVADFGELYRDYGHDLFMFRFASALGFAPQRIFDVGGSSGIWSALIHRVFPEACFDLFEPLAQLSNDYLETQRSNKIISNFLSSGCARIHPVALGERTGSCQMTVYPHAVGSTSIALDHVPAEARRVEVPQWSLDDYISEKDLLPPDLLKLDTQGAELEILRGARNCLSSVSAVLCECWLFRGYGSKTPLWIEVANFLRDYDLHLFDLGWTYRRPSDQRSATEDMLFLRRDLPFSPLNAFTKSHMKASYVPSLRR